MGEIKRVKNKAGWSLSLISKEIKNAQYYFFQVATTSTLNAIGEWLLKNPIYQVKDYKINSDVRGREGCSYTQREENFALWIQFEPQFNNDVFVIEVYTNYCNHKYAGTIACISLGVCDDIFTIPIPKSFKNKSKETIDNLVSEERMYGIEGKPSWVDMIKRDFKKMKERDEILSEKVKEGKKVRFSEEYFHLFQPAEDLIWKCIKIAPSFLKYPICTIKNKQRGIETINRYWLVPYKRSY